MPLSPQTLNPERVKLKGYLMNKAPADDAYAYAPNTQSYLSSGSPRSFGIPTMVRLLIPRVLNLTPVSVYLPSPISLKGYRPNKLLSLVLAQVLS
jgi:hypothetical protein